jgi:hypothetical protein
MTLNEAAERIIDNPDIHDLLTDALAGRPLRDHPFKELVKSQIDDYAKHGTTLAEEGFHPGQPWVGNIATAHILFLSSNPAFTYNENYPRYFAPTKSFAMPDKTPLSLASVRPLLHDCFRKNPVKDMVLKINIVGDGQKAVPYWGCVRNNVEWLLSGAAKNAMKNAAGSKCGYARMLMSCTVCMEIVPFKSNNEKGVAAALDKCWDDFTRHILPHAAAPIFVLVGAKVRDTFLRKALDAKEYTKAEKIFNNREIYRYTDARGTQRNVVNVGFLNGSINCFHTYFPANTLGELEKIMNSGFKGRLADPA